MFSILLKNKKILFLFLSSIALIVLGFFNSYLAIFAFLINVLALVFLKSEEFLILLVALSPWANVFKYNGYETSLFVILFLISSVVLAFRCKEMSSSFVILLLLLVLFIVSHFSFGNATSIVTIIKFVFGILFLFVACRTYNHSIRNQILLFFIISIFISSIVGLLVQNNMVLRQVGFEYSRFKGLQNDPNYYNSSLIISLFCLFYLFSSKHISFSFFVLSPLFIYFGLLTYSKSFILLLGILFLFIIIYSFHKKMYFVGLLLSLVSVSALVIVMRGNSGMASIIMRRFTEFGGGITTGRSDLWIIYLRYFFAEPFILLFGNGFETLTYDGYAAHNSYIDLVYYLGIIGSAIFIVLIYLSFNLKNNKSSHIGVFGFVFIFLIALTYFFLSGIVTAELPIVLFLCFVFITQNKQLMQVTT